MPSPDIAFTFRSTILGFLIGARLPGSALGLSFSVVQELRRHRAALHHLLRVAACSRSPRSSCWCSASGIASKVAIATALTLAGVDAHHLSRASRRSTLTAKSSSTRSAPRGPRCFRKLVIPSCLPWIISVLRVNIGLALTGAIVGGSSPPSTGLGRAIIYAGQTYDIALVWVAVSVLSALAIVMYVTVSWIERVLHKGVKEGTCHLRGGSAEPGIHNYGWE